MQRYIRDVLKSMHMKYEHILDSLAEQSARRTLAKCLVRAGAVSDRKTAFAFLARCSRLTGEADILEAVYKLGNPENHRKYELFLKKHGRKTGLLYHACFSEEQ